MWRLSTSALSFFWSILTATIHTYTHTYTSQASYRVDVAPQLPALHHPLRHEAVAVLEAARELAGLQEELDGLARVGGRGGVHVVGGGLDQLHDVGGGKGVEAEVDLLSGSGFGWVSFGLG